MAVDYEQRAAWHWDCAEVARAEGDVQLAADHEDAAGLCEQFAREDAAAAITTAA